MNNNDNNNSANSANSRLILDQKRAEWEAERNNIDASIGCLGLSVMFIWVAFVISIIIVIFA